MAEPPLSPAHRLAELAWAPRAPVLARLEAESDDAATTFSLLYRALIEDAERPGRRPPVRLLEQIASGLGLTVEAAALPLADGPRAITAVLDEAEATEGEAGETLAAAVALGYARHLARGDEPARRKAALRMVAGLPAFERWVGATPAEYIAAVCPADEALRFWRMYAERIAIEVNQRAAIQPSVERPWRLADMLEVGRGPEGPVSPAWRVLLGHVRRLLRAPVDGPRLVRRFVDRCHDPRTLRVICSSPTVLGDAETVFGWLTRGGGNSIGAALFCLQRGEAEPDVVERAAARLAARPLPEVADRVVDLYAQIHLLPAPTEALRQLAERLVADVGRRARQGSVATVLEAVQPDPRAFRHSLLLVEAAFEPGLWDAPQGRQLLERVVSTWIAGFTPAALDSPYNDDRYRAGVARALVALVEQRPTDTLRTLEALLASLPERAQQVEGATPGQVRRLEGRYRAHFAATVRRVARARRGAPDGEALWALLIEAAGADATDDWFGPLGSVVAALGDVGAAPEWLKEIDRPPMQAAMVAPARPAVTPEPVAEAKSAARPRPVAVEVSPQAWAPPAAIEAEVALLRGMPGVLSQVVRGYSGWSVLGGALAGLARRLGYLQTATARLVGRTLTVAQAAARGEDALGAHTVQHDLETLAGLRIMRPLRWFPLALGGVALVGCGLTGGWLVFAGLRAEVDQWVAGGVGMLVGGFVADTVLTRWAKRANRSAWIELSWAGASPLRLQVDTETGAPLLDALMAGEAARREVAGRGAWVAADGAWQGDEAAARARLADDDDEEGEADP